MLTDDEADVLFSTRNTVNNILQNTTGKSDTHLSSKSYTSGFFRVAKYQKYLLTLSKSFRLFYLWR